MAMSRSKYRSVAYDLESSIAVARAVARFGGDTSPGQLAVALGYAGANNGAFLSRMAAARAFGLLAGRSERVLLSDRARAVLAGGPAAAAARVEAFRAVPLFRAVLESQAGEELPAPPELAELLVDRFAENPKKAPSVARRLAASAAQAGIFADYDPSNVILPMVRSHWLTARSGGSTVKDDDEGLFLDDRRPAASRSARGSGNLRRAGVVAAAVACLAVVGVPISLVVFSGARPVALPQVRSHHPKGSVDLHLPSGPAEQEVISALSATTSSGSFRFIYHLSATTTTLPGAGGSSALEHHGTSVHGQGTIDTDPTAMLATTNVGVTVRLDATEYTEGGGTGLRPITSPGEVAGPESPLPQFASTVEGFLGTRVGGVAMLAMASPTGFLDLGQSEVTGAQSSGAGTVGGIPVTEYQVSLDPTSLATQSGITAEESQTISAALKVLQDQGLSGMTAELWIDATGFIERASTVTTFASGGTVTLQTTLSDFGCAGTVLMPGQQGTATPPAGCVSPDTGSPPTTTTATTTTTAGG